MFSPAINDIARDLNAPMSSVIGAATGYVLTMGIGPIVLAPMSETFGRRLVYFWCYGIFCVLQIPTALSPNVETLITLRVLCGLLGSCGIACGGGTINDMFVCLPTAPNRNQGLVRMLTIIRPLMNALQSSAGTS